MLVDGPLAPDPDWATRERWFIEDLGVDRVTYRGKSRPCLKSLDEGGPTVLWFEDDLFCHANLLYLASRAPTDGSWSLVCPSQVLAGRGADDWRRLHSERRPLGKADVQVARQAWEAYAGADPRRVEALAREPVPRSEPLARSLRLHLTRFPERRSGLDAIEHWFMEALRRGPRPFRELFGAFALDQRSVGWGMGDAQVAWRLRSLAKGGRPLLGIEGDLRDPLTWALGLTRDGQEVLAGRLDRVDAVGFDRWVGGVRVKAPGPVWRWDAREAALVRA